MSSEQFVLIRQHVDMLLDSERSTMEAVVVVDNTFRTYD